MGRVTVVAPRTEQSGVGHAITYRTPITAERAQMAGTRPGYAVTGTPADCVKFGILEVMDGRPDLIVSGMNLGMNLGQNLFYSGTVAAAVEGALFGVLSVAVSTCRDNEGTLDLAAEQAVRAIGVILAAPRALAYNVNVPALNGADPELRFTHQCAAQFPEVYSRQTGREDSDQLYQLQLCVSGDSESPEGCDVDAVSGGAISITPLRANLTDMRCLGAATPQSLSEG